ncbi:MULTISPECIES: OmpH family outer membrane protein [unclassified Paracoccus (in: a-proteobacteria)]|uniref:OmpH family outer membrane protein n=1 Tax=unclassified Paracoccus (in: a-proteobacteria) TaxID=2688777 RepID=UPI0012B43C31|nr:MULTISPECIES: OmpH family outer membrane protein [unclassified Paracoccus (in: a-proteobacteria)]UXU74636.1 OmpH family outer membrane protein [Paracoccus sp. SMMA_5]UXU80530.1 OmpH family outer membrane protein [Paracoccus sp. SMMA_5_TC]
MRGSGVCGLVLAVSFPCVTAAQNSAPATGGIGHDLPPLVVETADKAGEASLPLMTLDQDEVYLRSDWGQRVQAELEKQGRDIAAENDRLAEEFAAEEQQLTALRQSLPADEFRARADEFDKRVVEVRRERDIAARALQTRAEEERQAFFRAALPVLAALMKERGAVAVLDQRAIFVAAQSIDITDALIARLNQEIGAGPQPAKTEPEQPKSQDD